MSVSALLDAVASPRRQAILRLVWNAELSAGEIHERVGTALVDWVASAADGSPKARGTNVLTLAPSGLIAGIVGFWAEKA